MVCVRYIVVICVSSPITFTKCKTDTMPQTFQVLRCYQCQVFQVHQTKKSNKFQCKLCGEKQSIKRHYGIGTAKDCRGHVQRLNGIRGEIEVLKENRVSDTEEEDKPNDVKVRTPAKTRKSDKSKWSDYVDKNEEEAPKEAPETETMYLNNTKVVLEVPKKHRKTNFKCPSLKASNKTIENSYCEENVLSNALRSQTRQECIYFNNRDFDILNSNISSGNHYANIEPKAKFRESVKPFFNMERPKVGWGKIYPNTKETELIEPFVYTKPNVMFTNDGFQNLETKPEIKPIVNTLKEAKKIVAPSVNTNSKWAQFVEEEEEDDTGDTEDIEIFQEKHKICVGKCDFQNNDEEVDHYGPTPTGNKNSQELFALCNDNDLDDVLDI